MQVAWQAAVSYWWAVAQPDFSKSVLILVGHASSFDPDAAASVYQHAKELRRRGIFGEVREAFWKRKPLLADVIPGPEYTAVFVAPFFISEGYFAEGVIPESLGFKTSLPNWNRVQSRGPQVLLYCNVVGTHPDLGQIAVHRVREVVEQFPFPRAPKPADISVIIAGHGTEREPKSREAVEALLRRVGATNTYAQVAAVYLEEQPQIAAVYDLARTRQVVVVPFFVGEGPHVKKDIPMALGVPESVVLQRLDAGQGAWRNPTEKQGKLVWYAQPIGTDPRMADIVLERVREAAEWV